jgi:hypothetical protein
MNSLLNVTGYAAKSCSDRTDGYSLQKKEQGVSIKHEKKISDVEGYV